MAFSRVLVGLAFALLLEGVRACSDVGLFNQKIYPGAYVSMRNYDFFAESILTLDMAAIPASTSIMYSPVGGCEPSIINDTPTKYAFMCMTSARGPLIALLKERCPKVDTRNYVGICMDGMNMRGLGVGLLTHNSARAPPFADKSLNKTAIYANDLVAFILANYATVDEVRQKLTSSAYQAVQNEGLFEFLQSRGSVAATRKVHYVMHDATGNSGVLEFTEQAAGPYTWVVRPNPSGVTTNAPELPTQEAYHDAFVRSQSQTFTQTFNLQGPRPTFPKASGNWPYLTPGFCGVGYNITNGQNMSCNSMGRYTTLRMLKEYMVEQNGPFRESFYPQSPANNPSKTHQAIVQLQLMLGWVTIPGQYPSYPGQYVVGPGEMTLTQFIRDYRGLKYYMRTVANPQWISFDLQTVFRGLKTPIWKAVEQLAPNTMTWALGKEAQLLATAPETEAGPSPRGL